MMVVLAVVMMVPVPFFLAVDSDMHMQPPDAALDVRLGGDDGFPGEGFVDLFQEFRLPLLIQQIQQGAGQHIAGDTHAAVYVQCSHLLFSLGVGSRLTSE